jgi:hypothetical protein
MTHIEHEELEVAEDALSAQTMIKIAVQNQHNDNIVYNMSAVEIAEIKGHRIQIVD